MMMRSIFVAGVLLVLHVLLPGVAGAQGGVPGGAGGLRRDFGPLSVECIADSSRPWSTVTLSLQGTVVGRKLLTPDSAEYWFAVASAGDSAGGVLRLQPAAPPHYSSVEGAFVTRKGGGAPVPFQGSLITWQAARLEAEGEYRFRLSPQLEAVTRVNGASKTEVMVTLFSGEVSLYTVAMVQGSPVAVIDSAIIFGDAWFAPGTRFTLTIPTPAQSGQVFMQGEFRSAGIPATPISAAIATWFR